MLKRIKAIIAIMAVGASLLVAQLTVGIAGASAATCSGAQGWYINNAISNTQGAPAAYISGVEGFIDAHTPSVCSGNSGAYAASWIGLEDPTVGGIMKVGYQYSPSQGCNEEFAEYKANASSPDYLYILGPGHCVANNTQLLMGILWDPNPPDDPHQGRYDFRIGGQLFYEGLFPQWNPQQTNIRIGQDANFLVSNVPGSQGNPTNISGLIYEAYGCDTCGFLSITNRLNLDYSSDSNPTKWGRYSTGGDSAQFFTWVVQ